MNPNLRTAIILTSICLIPTFCFCQTNPYKSIREIPLPSGFIRTTENQHSFTEWLRNLRLKENKTVHLYNGALKKNQSVQFAVLDISVGNKDLQQCADAVMRLRAEFLYSQRRFGEISFTDNGHHQYRLNGPFERKHFDEYLENVFAKCGSLSLQNQLKPFEKVNNLEAGDVLIQGGSPGHAMTVVDVAINIKSGKKILLLAQSYMPAQDIHIVINPINKTLSPWYELNDETVVTPEWIFPKGHFRKW